MSSLENLPNSHFESINDFLFSEQNKPLGSGSFGVVRKAIHKMTNKIKLQQDITQSELLLLSREISIHYKLDHPHIIKLWAVLSENDKLYMIMDYAENGNLFSYLNKKNGIAEHESFKIFYQVLEAVQYMHRTDVFHRDLKPENILLDHQMNVKICDFGWVADDIHRKRTTFCGTYQYMAPQMISQIPYNYKIDVWAMGILLYELNHGKAPFQAQTIESIKVRFEKGIYQIKQDVSQAFKVLIVSLLQFQPTKRLQISQIKQSQWVQKNKKYFQNLAAVQLKPLSEQKHLESSQGTLASSVSKQIDKKRQLLHNNYISNAQYYGNSNSKNMEGAQQQKKRHRKKYKTLEQEELYCVSHNLKLTTSKHQQSNLNLNINTKVLQPISENVGHKGNNIINSLTNQALPAQKTTRKKKIGSARGHMRTQSSQVLMNKFNKIIFHSDKNRIPDHQKQKDDKKKRQFTKR